MKVRTSSPRPTPFENAPEARLASGREKRDPLVILALGPYGPARLGRMDGSSC